MDFGEAWRKFFEKVGGGSGKQGKTFAELGKATDSSA